MRVRLRRLREPRYLIGAIVGVAYLYFSFFARFRAIGASAARRAARTSRAARSRWPRCSRRRPRWAASRCWRSRPARWLMPVDSGLLEFSDAGAAVPVSGAGVAAPAADPPHAAVADRACCSARSSSASCRPSALGFVAAAAVDRRVDPAGHRQDLLHRRHAGARAARRRAARGRGASRGCRSAVLVVALAVVARRDRRANVQQAPPSRSRWTRCCSSAASRRAGARASSCGRSWRWRGRCSPNGRCRISIALGCGAGRHARRRRLGAAERRGVPGGGRPTSPSAAARSRRRRATPSYKVRSAGWTLAPIGRPEMAFAWKAAMQTLRMVDRGSLVRDRRDPVLR